MKKRFSEAQIVEILQEAEAADTHREIIRKHNISEQTFYKWKRTYGGMSIAEVKRPKRKRPGNTARELQSLHTNHVWSYDFVSDRTANGQKLKILVVVDEHTRECLALEVAASIRAHHLIDTLSRLMTLHGKPKFIRSDNGPEFTANALIKWLTQNHVGSAFIKPGAPWQNAYVESFNGKFRDECLSREWFLNRKEAQVMIEKWRYNYNHERPHSSLNNQPPSKVSGRQNAA